VPLAFAPFNPAGHIFWFTNCPAHGSVSETDDSEVGAEQLPARSSPQSHLATVDAVRYGVLPGGYIRDIVERVTPSVLAAQQAGMSTADEIEAEHVRHTLGLLTERSRLVGDRVASGQLAVVGAVYNLRDGSARIVDPVGLNPTS
jgi:hypothetical protein